MVSDSIYSSKVVHVGYPSQEGNIKLVMYFKMGSS